MPSRPTAQLLLGLIPILAFVSCSESVAPEPRAPMELEIPFAYSLTEAIAIAVPGDTLLFTNTLSPILVSETLVISGNKTPLLFRGDKNKAVLQGAPGVDVLRFDQPQPGTRLTQFLFRDGGTQISVNGGSLTVDNSDFDGGTLMLNASGSVVSGSNLLLRDGTRAIELHSGSSLDLTRTTVVEMTQAGILVDSNSSLLLSNSIVARSGTGISCTNGGVLQAESRCNNVWGSTESDWSGCEPSEDSFSLDPEFCDAINNDYTLFSYSPCSAANAPSGCGLIGGRPVACEPTAP